MTSRCFVKNLHEGFNPHTYMRCDYSGCWYVWCFCVSIHTPTWGVTCRRQFRGLYLWFQSTHLHEVWLNLPLMLLYKLSFNPHTYMRCDTTVISRYPLIVLFQSTHLHEVWPRLMVAMIMVKVSIHTPTWGVTPICPFLSWFFPGFNPHTYMRCD